MSRCLAERSIDHVVLERGEVAQLVAHRALGLAAAADAELAEPAARLRLRGRRSRRLPDDARGRRLHRRLRAGDRRAGADPHDGHVGAPRPRRDTSCAPTRATGAAGRSCSRPAPATSPRVPALRRARCRAAIATLTPQQYRNPGQLADGGVLVVGASATRHPDRRRDPPLGPPGDARRSASTSACRASTAAGTSSGGWTPPACSTSATTRSTTSRGRAACRRCSSSARPSARRSTSTR